MSYEDTLKDNIVNGGAGCIVMINGRRIKNLSRHLGGIPEGRAVIIGLPGLNRFDTAMQQLGFPEEATDGDTLLPPSSFGPVSRFNAEGKFTVHRDQEMETAYRQAQWTWTERHGRDTVERTEVVDVPYRRYPRSFNPPPSVEMSLATDGQGNRLLVTPPIEFTSDNEHRLVHTINLFLEIFGQCMVFGDQLDVINLPRIQRVNWEILPQGRMPWTALKEELSPIIGSLSKGRRPVVEQRLQSVNQLQPEYVVTGVGGFRGYVIFAFPSRQLFILESARFGNATYVFGEDWETLSQMTKAEILDGQRQQDRLVHRLGWNERLNSLFTNPV